jgi:hypothetical protein
VDDDPDLDAAPMTLGERTVWVYLVVVVVTSGVYFAAMVPAALTRPAREIAWVGPMLWTMGASILATIVGSIAVAIGDRLGGPAVFGRAARRRGEPRQGATCEGPDGEPATDVRDAEIAQVGGRASTGVLGVALAAGLALAMLDVDTFWIGNALFLFGTVGAIVETTTKIRLYRRGF